MAKTATARTFQSVLDMPASAIEPPKTLPVGSYICVVQGQPEFGEAKNTGTKFAKFTGKILSPLDDVSQEDLETFLLKKDGSKKVLGEQTLKVTFWLTDDSVYRLWQFFEHCGLDIKEAEKQETTTNQMIAELPGCQFVAHITHTAGKDGERLFANVDTTSSVE